VAAALRRDGCAFSEAFTGLRVVEDCIHGVDRVLDDAVTEFGCSPNVPRWQSAAPRLGDLGRCRPDHNGRGCPTPRNVAVLGFIVLIRTFLSVSLEDRRTSPVAACPEGNLGHNHHVVRDDLGLVAQQSLEITALQNLPISERRPRQRRQRVRPQLIQSHEPDRGSDRRHPLVPSGLGTCAIDSHHNPPALSSDQMN
jgi:hypothetical protein